MPKILLSTSQDDPSAYIEAVTLCGAEPVAAYCPVYKEEYDGLILCGGADVHPSLYGEEVAGSVNMDTARDAAELALIRAFLAADKPILGICRGFQLLNVYFGGTLHQHLCNASVHSPEKEGCYLAHFATALPGSICHSLYGPALSINSHHHQGVKALAPDLRATMYAEGSDVMEALEHTSLPVSAVQWHPERMCFRFARPDTVDGAPIFREFISTLSPN